MKTFKRSKIKVKTINDNNNATYNDVFNLLVVDPAETIVEKVSITPLSEQVVYARTSGTNSHGAILTNNSYYATDWINVSECTYIDYLNTVSGGSSPKVGLHFYKQDKTPVTEQGNPLLKSTELQPREVRLPVPETAYYVRFCFLKEYKDEVYAKLVRKRSVDNLITVADKVTAIQNRIPVQAPTTAGNYILKVEIIDNVPIYSWIPASQN